MCGRGNGTRITVKDSTKYKANHSENKQRGKWRPKMGTGPDK